MVDAHDDRRATRSPSPSPSPEVLVALRDQWTPPTVRDLHRYAEQRARMVRVSGRACPPPGQYARELVHDAHADTWCGDLTWDPDRCSLAMHLRGVIKSRTWTEIQKAPRFVSLDGRPANDSDPADGSPIQVHVALSASSGNVGPVVFPLLVARVCAELHKTAYEHHDCFALVRAWERGFTEREEIMEITGLDPVSYRRARKRLFYASSNLPASLRQFVQDYLRSAS